MCLYPKLIKNKKYTKTKKNGGIIPPISDERTLYVPIGCGKCIECMKQKKRNWQVRLLEEIKTDRTGKFVTLFPAGFPAAIPLVTTPPITCVACNPKSDHVFQFVNSPVLNSAVSFIANALIISASA